MVFTKYLGLNSCNLKKIIYKIYIYYFFQSIRYQTKSNYVTNTILLFP